MKHAIILAAALISVLAAPLPAAETRSRVEGVAAPAADIADLAWLAGHWVGEGLGGRATEVYSAPAGGQIVGHFGSQDKDGSVQKRDAKSDLGGTMRLGAQSADVQAGTLAHRIYGDVVTERHRHRYEANVNYLDRLRDAGLVISALTQREHLTEIVELPQSVHPWFVGVQFHPEFKSTPWDGHPLFNAFIKAAMDHQAAGKSLKAVA